MTDMAIIQEMEKILKVPLKKLEPAEIEKINIGIKRGYALDAAGIVSGLRLQSLFIKPVLEWLGRLHGINRLNLEFCQLEQKDIHFLLHNKGLSYLNISNNKSIQDFSFLRELKGLTSVDLSLNNLTDVSFLRELPGLTSVNLSGNENLKDVSFLRELKGLTSVALSYNKLKDVSFLRELQGLTSVDLSGNENLKDVSFLRELKGLTSVDLGYNKLTDVSFLRELPGLTSVDLGYNNLKDVSFLRELKGLTSVALSYNKLKDVSFLRELPGLTSVDLSGNKNLNDVSFLRELQGLTSVALGYNNLTDVSFLRELKGLTSVDLGYNNLKDVSFLRELKGLTSVNLSGNELTDVSFLRELPGLTWVDLSYNNLTDVSFLWELKGLTSVALRSNNLTDVSFLRELKGLTSVDLSWNNLTYVSFVADLPFLSYLYIDNNPITNPPPEIAKQGLEAIQDYFRALKESAEKQLDEVKVLLVGDGGAGKTSLFKQLKGETFNEQESKTHGININTLDFLVVLANNQHTVIHAHFWDFGGQEIMHASHQFFLSKRSLYILVLDSRKETKIEYWFKHIESFGGTSPVLVVINKTDENPAYDLDRFTLLQKYPHIKGFYRTSCKTGAGLTEFKNAVQAVIPKIELLQTAIPATWLNVKEDLEKTTALKNYVNQQEFATICTEEKIPDDSSRTTLIQFLNELGIVLHFKQSKLTDFHVLNPKWVTEAVYKIINSPFLAKNKGFLHKDKLDYVLNKEKVKNCLLEQSLPDITYSPTEQNYIVDLMERFELCYTFAEEKILIPDLLEKQAPDYKIEEAGALQFNVTYDFLPRYIMPRLIVKLHREIKQELRWHTGMVLENHDFHVTALVRADDEDKTIYIQIAGERKREYLAIIRHNLLEIHNSFPHLSYKEIIPLPISPVLIEKYNGLANVPKEYNKTVAYSFLLGYESEGKDDYFEGDTRTHYSVSKLLNSLVKPEERQQERMAEEKISKMNAYPRHEMSREEVNKLLAEINDLENQLQKEETLKNLCDEQAEKHTKWFTWWLVGVIVLMSVIGGIVIYLLDWNKMEKWTFLLSVGLFDVSLVFLGITGRGFNVEESRKRRLEKEQKKQYGLNKFSINEYEELKDRLTEVRKRLNPN